LAPIAGETVNSGSHVIENLGDILNFIQDNRALHLLKEGPWIGAQPGDHVGIFKKVIRGLREYFPQERGFSRAPGAGHDQRVEMTGCPNQLGRKDPRNEFHNEYFKLIL
jgi:hypothetical protein